MDQVKEQTRVFLSQNIAENYFTGEQEVSLSSSLGEAEVLYAANDDVKTLAANGSLKTLHENCAALTEAAEQQYISTKDRLENLLLSIQAKEDEIIENCTEDYEVAGLKRHDQSAEVSLTNLVDMVKGGTIITAENISLISQNDASKEDHGLGAQFNDLVALGEVKKAVYEQLAALQSEYNTSVERDAAGEHDLAGYKTQHAALGSALSGLSSGSDAGKLFNSQLAEATPLVEGACNTFQ